MENVSDALIMAGQALIFLVALTVCISSFTTVRVGIDNIIEKTETVKFAKTDKGYINFIESSENASVRVVDAEAVVSSMYRAIKENFVVYIKLNSGSGLNSNVVQCTAQNDIEINGKSIITQGSTVVIVSTGMLDKNAISGFSSSNDFLNNYDMNKLFNKDMRKFL